MDLNAQIPEDHGDLEELLAEEMAFWAAPHPLTPDGFPTTHRYLSTYCLHGLHEQCRRTCKICHVGCLCEDPQCSCCITRGLWTTGKWT